MHQPNTNTQPTKHCNCHETLHQPPSNTYFLLPLDTASFYGQVPPIFSYGWPPPPPIATPIPFSWHSSWKNANQWHPIWALLPRIFLYNSTPRGWKTDWLKWSTTLCPIEFYSSIQCTLTDPTFLAHNFFAILLVTLPSCPFAPFVTMLKAKSKTTAHTERADCAARIHKHNNQVSLEEELDQISAANAVGHSKMKKQSKARAAFNAQTMVTKAKLKKTPAPNDSVKDKDSCLDSSIKKFLFCKDTVPTFSTLEASKLKKVRHNGTTPDKKTPSLNPKATDFTPITSPPPPPQLWPKWLLWPWAWIPLFTSHHHKFHQPLCCFRKQRGGDKTKVMW